MEKNMEKQVSILIVDDNIQLRRVIRVQLESAGFEVENLFTEVIPGYGTDLWVKDFLERNHYPTALRGEQMYCLAKKRSGRPTVRYPHFLYEGC